MTIVVSCYQIMTTSTITVMMTVVLVTIATTSTIITTRTTMVVVEVMSTSTVVNQPASGKREWFRWVSRRAVHGGADGGAGRREGDAVAL